MTHLDISEATLRARFRTGDASICTRPRNGLFQIVSVTRHHGINRVQTMSEWMPLGRVIAALNAMQSEEEIA